uniref:Uncharacterized protein n=1 Tax=Anguilla anguilla TaxID=7936 RepID=A0A0E9PMD7_ANGAN
MVQVVFVKAPYSYSTVLKKNACWKALPEHGPRKSVPIAL